MAADMGIYYKLLPSVMCFIVVWLIGNAEEPIKVTLLATSYMYSGSSNNLGYQCYVSEPGLNIETDVTMTFTRHVWTRNTESENSDPPEAEYHGHSLWPRYRVDWNNVQNNNVFGVFDCTAHVAGKIDTTVSHIRLRSDADVLPVNRLLSQTFNIGDTEVSIDMMSPTGRDVSTFRWKRDNRPISSTDGLSNYTIMRPLQLDDAGVYECYISGKRKSAKQALNLLIVRACPATRWGPPACIGVCTSCYNGGICDENTGKCVCPPGFNGSECKKEIDFSYLFGNLYSFTRYSIRICSTDHIRLSDSTIYIKQNPGIPGRVTCVAVEGPGGDLDSLDLVASRDQHELMVNGIVSESSINKDSTNSRSRTFIITNVSEGDKLYCQLRKNDQNMAMFKVTVEVYDLPLLKSSPEVVSIFGPLITISWSPWEEGINDGDGPVVGYTLYFREDKVTRWSKSGYVSASEPREYIYTNLEPETSYMFSVAAVREGDGGEGPRGPSLNVTTRCKVPLSPVNPSATIDSESFTVVISWKFRVTHLTIYCNAFRFGVYGEVPSWQLRKGVVERDSRTPLKRKSRTIKPKHNNKGVIHELALICKLPSSAANYRRCVKDNAGTTQLIYRYCVKGDARKDNAAQLTMRFVSLRTLRCDDLAQAQAATQRSCRMHAGTSSYAAQLQSALLDALHKPKII
ncbi:putative tyrosine-protein kinase [Apostichopus japonicus]|uniref:Putative tyrosine-protein kinase n=1 Tax=Stichopus japonicus TaxID=307972 RepID=A0A2G8KZB0_STIJA|nr:putative tyrosine-protein kinase [Apostichopus japonicus]